MFNKKIISLSICIVLLSVIFSGCIGQPEIGTLEFRANGEDFIREGFVSKDGWRLTFDQVYITLADITAYQTNPPYNPKQHGANIRFKVKSQLPGTHLVDLAKGPEDAPPIFVGEVKNVPVGHYNAISWRVIKAPEGPAKNYSMVIIGTAEKEGQILNFTIRFEEECRYIGGEFIGEVRKGILQHGGIADLEMTFHFDHLFGDAALPLDEPLNIRAAGFEMFAVLAVDSVIDMVVSDLETRDYQKVKNIFYHLGHVGEGHCYCEPI